MPDIIPQHTNAQISSCFNCNKILNAIYFPFSFSGGKADGSDKDSNKGLLELLTNGDQNMEKQFS